MKKLSHPHIVKFFGKSNDKNAIFMEYSQCGSLRDLLKVNKLKSEQIANFTY